MLLVRASVHDVLECAQADHGGVFMRVCFSIQAGPCSSGGDTVGDACVWEPVCQHFE